MLSVRLPDDLQERLSRLAENTGMSQSHHVCEAVAVYLDDMEDVLLAEQRWLDVRSGESQLRDLDEVERMLGDAPQAD